MNHRDIRTFGVIPAAGSSKRMGQNKLLLPFRGTQLIQHVMDQWAQSRVDEFVVVVNRHDAKVLQLCRASAAHCVAPTEAPRDMKASVQAALGYLAENMQPTEDDAWLLAPADMPLLPTRVIDLLIESHDPASPSILVPCYQSKRGHPALLPWSYHLAVLDLHPDAGVNSLLNQFAVKLIEVDEPGILSDINTPQDYSRFAAE